MALTKRLGLHFYDGKRIWEKYMSLGKAATLKRVAQWCQTESMSSPVTGRVNITGIKFAMWRYAIRNPEEAYIAYKAWQMEYGNYPTFYDFCLDLLDHAYTKKTCVISEKEKKKFEDKYVKPHSEIQNVSQGSSN